MNHLVQSGISFRDAYHQIATEVANGTFEFVGRIEHQMIGGMSNLANDIK